MEFLLKHPGRFPKGRLQTSRNPPAIGRPPKDATDTVTAEQQDLGIHPYSSSEYCTG